MQPEDSGSLVFFHDKNNQRQAFAYCVYEVDELILANHEERVVILIVIVFGLMRMDQTMGMTLKTNGMSRMQWNGGTIQKVILK